MHEVLQGTVWVHRQHLPPKQFWETRLAFPFAPRLCEAFAHILFVASQAAARTDGASMVSQDWERALIRAISRPGHQQGGQAAIGVPAKKVRYEAHDVPEPW